MNRGPLKSKLYYRVCCLALFFIAAAASFNGYYDKYHFREAGTSGFTGGRGLDMMLDGTADRPYVYRQLLPMLANWIDQRVPDNLKDRLYAAKGQRGGILRERLVDSPLAQNRTYFLRYWIVYSAVFLSAWFSVHAMYMVGKSVGFPPVGAAFAAIAMILLMPYFLTGGGYFYDYPELAFYALVVWMALKVDWWWIIPAVMLATWNKESFLFFIPTIFPLLRLRSSRMSALWGTAALGLACASVYFLLRLRFQHNPGGAVEEHLVDQIQVIIHPSNLLSGEKTYGLMALPAYNPATVFLIVWTALRGWRHLPLVIQRHAQIAALINFPLFILFCSPGELRDLSMLYITFLLLLAANFAIWISGQPNARLEVEAEL